MKKTLLQKLEDNHYPFVLCPKEHGVECDEDHWCQLYHIPSIGELIRNCGNKFDFLNRLSRTTLLGERITTWIATDAVSLISVSGDTPEEAVANLWLELHAKT